MFERYTANRLCPYIIGENMENTQADMNKWSNICFIFSFLMMLISIADFFVYNGNYFISMMLVSFAALFSSIKMRAETDIPVLRFAAGLCIVVAIFSQAIIKQNQYFAISGLAILVVFAVDYFKHSKHMKNPA